MFVGHRSLRIERSVQVGGNVVLFENVARTTVALDLLPLPAPLSSRQVSGQSHQIAPKGDPGVYRFISIVVSSLQIASREINTVNNNLVRRSTRGPFSMFIFIRSEIGDCVNCGYCGNRYGRCLPM